MLIYVAMQIYVHYCHYVFSCGHGLWQQEVLYRPLS